MPQLTEQWASAYFQLLFGLFVLSLGIPTLLADEDIRRVVRKRMKPSQWALFTCTVFAPALLFVWWLHPGVNPLTSSWRTWVAHGIITLYPLLFAIGNYFVFSTVGREGIIHWLEKKAKKEFKKFQSDGRLQSINITALADLIYLGQYGKPGYEKA